MKILIVFDLDGVITSEDAYWDAAGLTVHELLYSPRYWHLGSLTDYRPVATAEESRRLSRNVLPEEEILLYKSYALNSNWDTCYAAVCRRLIALLERLATPADLLPLRPWEAAWLERLRALVSERAPSPPGGEGNPFEEPPFQGAIGLELLNRLDAYASQRLGLTITGVFSRLSPFWSFCREIFQEWYLGDALYTRTAGQPPRQSGKPGCIHFERPLLPPEQLRQTLAMVQAAGYKAGLATGRVSQEAALPLQSSGLLSSFDPDHLCPYDVVEQAEAELRRRGDQTLLGKPHPFQFLYALDRRAPDQSQEPAPPFIVVGDSAGDILGGRAAGALTVATLSGARTPEARARLLACAPDFVIENVCQLPALLAEIDQLATIQRLQFDEREKAERLLRLWFARHLDLAAERVTLVPRAVSLNSFNGTYQQQDEAYFFKTHVEEQSALSEYYHAELLHEAGYNMVMPLRTVRQQGRQMVIYPLVRWPLVFDLARALENGTPAAVTAETLLDAERRACEQLLSIYQRTARQSEADEHAAAPIHQLFWHRLTGGRLASFYRGRAIDLPDGETAIPFEELLDCAWTINERRQARTLGALLEEAERVLAPPQPALTVIGHGDAHFGNVFLERERDYLYFDPAFAGRHSPLLDVVKPLFHNVFASWMYFPREEAGRLQLAVSRASEHGARLVTVRHTYRLTPLRRAILDTKRRFLLQPLLSWLRAEQALPVHWERLLALALMCCPLLTINLMERERLPASICWLGLTQAVELGNGSLIPWLDRDEEPPEEYSYGHDPSCPPGAGK